MADDQTDSISARRAMWRNTGARRPPFADQPAPGHESVWDYPRPPVAVADERRVIVASGDPSHPPGDDGARLADTTRSIRVLETASPPTFYIPSIDVRRDRLVETAAASMCEWKGHARYLALAEAPDVPVAWEYPNPFPEFAVLAEHVACYPGRLACWVDGERVRAQAGGFYGGWVTDDIAGPFKGDPGTAAW